MEHKLQTAVYQFRLMYQECNMKISVFKTKVLAFRGAEPVRPKVVIDKIILE